MDQQHATRGEVAEVEGQLRSLVKLQELDLAIKQFEAAIAAKPHELDPLMRALDDARTSATKHHKDLTSLDKQRRQLEAAVTEEQDNLQKAQRKLLEVKTNKEYAAMVAEIETFKQKILSHEDAVLHLMELTELRKQELLDLDRQVHDAEQDLTEGRRRNELELAVLQETLAGRRLMREEAVQQLERPAVDLYTRLLSGRMPGGCWHQEWVLSGMFPGPAAATHARSATERSRPHLFPLSAHFVLERRDATRAVGIRCVRAGQMIAGPTGGA